jgi:hypothetical protein
VRSWRFACQPLYADPPSRGCACSSLMTCGMRRESVGQRSSRSTRGQSLHRKSLTATFEGRADGCSNTESTESSYWTSRSLKDGVEMYEQVLVQSRGYRTDHDKSAARSCLEPAPDD